ncbi:S41 family peptidase [Paraflavitalea speifideaquila]|uniref:S41 family peptidase n=1 Tax=Paraflavitalea speifideaquila TaxID=3076558 RepID=UPI0028E731ED|nr:S41 family peptidase [Paraflavitalea speifideiaquila]
MEVYLSKDTRVKKLTGIPVYIIVSKKTSSAAESVAYTLQALKRAVIIGEQTNGEANPGFRFPIDSTLYMMIPTVANINAITKTNWEGTGVIPDIKINADKALLTAQVEAMRKLLSAVDVQELQQLYKWKLFELKSQLNPQQADSSFLSNIQGLYSNGRVVTYDNNSVYYEAKDKMPPTKLTYLMENTFGVEGRPGLRIQFVTNTNGTVKELVALWDDEVRQVFAKIAK